jgi:uncharacterized membrane protein YgdD (TMEM256/DUF423 family)
MTRPHLVLGAISGGLAVAAGAFGAHALRAHLDAGALAIWETGARYQMYHALALVVIGAAGERLAGAWARRAGWCFVAGTVLFSGSLYLLAVTGTSWLGAITPLGGVAFLGGWGCLAVAGYRMPDRP